MGVGQEIETSQLGSMIALQGLNVMSALLMDRELPVHCRKKARNPLWNHYLCADNRWLSLACLQSDRYWPDFCKVLGIESLEKDPKFVDMFYREENCEELIEILDKIFLTKKREEWMEALLDGGEFIFSPINTIPDLASDPQVLESEYIVDFDHPVYGSIKVLGFPVWMSKTPAKVRCAAPELGQHTEEVLMEICGYDWDQIGELKDQKII
jgi:formyl-CoA transferase